MWQCQGCLAGLIVGSGLRGRCTCFPSLSHLQHLLQTRLEEAQQQQQESSGPTREERQLADQMDAQLRASKQGSSGPEVAGHWRSAADSSSRLQHLLEQGSKHRQLLLVEAVLKHVPRPEEQLAAQDRELCALLWQMRRCLQASACAALHAKCLQC